MEAHGATEKKTAQAGKPAITNGIMRECNLCEKKFRPESKFVRFCDECRMESEDYLNADWLSESA